MYCDGFRDFKFLKVFRQFLTDPGHDLALKRRVVGRPNVQSPVVIDLQPAIPLKAKNRNMIPFWIELNPEDLIQGTVVMSLAVYFLIFTLTSSARSA